MVAEVFQHVVNRIADFAGSIQHVRMVSVQEYLPRTGSQPVQGLRKAYRQALDGAREHGWIIDFDDQVQMVPLDRVVHDAQSETMPDRAERILDCAYAAPAAQEPHAGEQA